MPGEIRRGAQLPYKVIAGVVPCPAGWLVASAKLQGVTMSPEDPVTMPTLIEVLDTKPAFTVIALAAPVGLPDEPLPGGRVCDVEARHVLGWPRSTAVVSPPSRQELAALEKLPGDHDVHVSAVGRSLATRIAEVDAALSPYWQRVVREVHPELSFFQLNEDKPLRRPKHTLVGVDERRALLEARMPGVVRILDKELPDTEISHLVDAAASLWTARRIMARAVVRIPDNPIWDSRGLRVEFVR
ncbi:MAG: DUF429 domain-containing protein [Acidimicrobiales bacterium]